MFSRELLRGTRSKGSSLRQLQLGSCRTFSSTKARDKNVIDELESRGMIHELTSRAIKKHVEDGTNRSVYLGVDPSASSLHVGNLLTLIGLLHFKLRGHTAIALIGGATGSVGDPSGRSTERLPLSPAALAVNVASITSQITSFLTKGVPFALSRTNMRFGEKSDGAADRGTVKVVNNLDWLGGMGLLEFLSSVGKGARMATMLSRDSVKSRLDSPSGLSFTEFTYQLLQAYDFLTLHRTQQCTIQLGGSDQLGNIASGIEMIRKAGLADVEKEGTTDGDREGEQPAYGVTMPLLTTASGEKFGKSAGNAVWLDPSMTSPFAFYQFFLRTTDEEVLRYLKIFSFIRVIEMDGIMQEHAAFAGGNFAQKVLAAEATELVHGKEGLRQAFAATSLFYNTPSPTPASLIEYLDGSVNSDAPLPTMIVRLKRDDVIGKPLVNLTLASGLIQSKTRARAAIESGSLHLNHAKIPPQSHMRLVSESDIAASGLIILRAGKNVHKAVLLVE